MYALLAFLPILFCVVMMAAFNWPAKYALPLSFLMAAIFGMLFWEMELLAVLAYAISGLLNSLDVLITIMGALVVMNTLKRSGAMGSIHRGFQAISKDARIQAILVGWMFVSFLEGAAGFGTPAALAGPLLVSLGFPPVAAAAVALICDSTAVSFGAIGTPVTQAIACLGPDIATDAYQKALSFWSVLPHAVSGTLIPFIAVAVMCRFFTPQRSFKPALQVLPFALFAGLCFTLPYLLIATLIGYEFPAILGSLIGLVLVVVAAKKGFLVPKEVWTFPPEDTWDKAWKANTPVQEPHENNIPLWKAWLPYVIIAVLLVVTRIPALGLKSLLQSSAFTVRFPALFGTPNTAYTLKWAFLPGTTFMLVALLTVVLHKMAPKEAVLAWKDTFRQISGAAVAVVFGLGLVQIMRFSGSNDVNDPLMKSMIFYMAEALSSVGKALYLAISPVIGVLGAFVSGSNTVSNTLFTNLQYQSAQNLGLPTLFIVAMQNTGGAIGNMICVNNVVAACATVGTSGKEGQLIRINVIPAALYTLLTIAVFAVALWVFGCVPAVN